ncbi:E3 ubiquitin-protein ligase [Sesbania bispinosa]|nr:E3 ubiquitin-protein ligase [Sesbania bispinosa]
MHGHQALIEPHLSAFLFYRLRFGIVPHEGFLVIFTAGGSRHGETYGRSYSMGTFECFIDEEAEVPFSHAHRRIVSGEKDDLSAIESPADSQ